MLKMRLLNRSSSRVSQHPLCQRCMITSRPSAKSSAYLFPFNLTDSSLIDYLIFSDSLTKEQIDKDMAEHEARREAILKAKSEAAGTE